MDLMGLPSANGMLYLFAIAVGGFLTTALLKVIFTVLARKRKSSGGDELRSLCRTVADVEIFIAVMIVGALVAKWHAGGLGRMWAGSGIALVFAATMLVGAVLVYFVEGPKLPLWIWCLLWSPVIGIVVLCRGDTFLLVFFSPMYLAFGAYLIWLRFLKKDRDATGYPNSHPST